MIKIENKNVPEKCSNMDDIRTEIDLIDKRIIQAIAERFKYVKAAAKFKNSETSVKAPERFKTMLLQRRVWAQESGLSPGIIEKIFSDLVNYFIEEELKRWQKEN